MEMVVESVERKKFEFFEDWLWYLAVNCFDIVISLGSSSFGRNAFSVSRPLFRL